MSDVEFQRKSSEREHVEFNQMLDSPFIWDSKAKVDSLRISDSDRLALHAQADTFAQRHRSWFSDIRYVLFDLVLNENDKSDERSQSETGVFLARVSAFNRIYRLPGEIEVIAIHFGQDQRVAMECENNGARFSLPCVSHAWLFLFALLARMRAIQWINIVPKPVFLSTVEERSLGIHVDPMLFDHYKHDSALIDIEATLDEDNALVWIVSVSQKSNPNTKKFIHLSTTTGSFNNHEPVVDGCTLFLFMPLKESWALISYLAFQHKSKRLHLLRLSLREPNRDLLHEICISGNFPCHFYDENNQLIYSADI